MKNGKKYIYDVIVEKYKEDNKWKMRELYRLGKLSPEERKNVKLWLSLNPGKKENLGKRLLTLEDLEKEDTRFHGEIILGHLLFKQTGLHNILIEAFNGVDKKLKKVKLVEIMVINRLVEPMSKYALLDWIPKTTFPFILNITWEKLYEGKFYEAMDVLWEKKDKIERKIFDRIVAPTMDSNKKVLMKDLTSSLVYGEGTEDMQYGYPRDHRWDCKQICWGLMATEKGLPITLEVYPGNTSDETTVKQSIMRTKNTFGIKKGIFVGDRGMKNPDNVKGIKKEEYNYILAETNREVKPQIEEGLKKKFVEIEEGKKYYNGQGVYIGNEATEVLMNDIRYIVIRNRRNYENETELIEERLKKGEDLLKERGAIEVDEETFRQSVKKLKRKKEKLSKTVTEKIRIAHDKLVSLRGKLKEIKADRYYKPELDHGNEQFVYWKKKKKIEEDMKYRGIWVLSTDTDDTDLKIAECVRIYKMLNRIENIFRTIKSKLRVRPIWHRRSDRARSHIFICDIAYLISRLVELKLKEKGMEMNFERVFEMFENSTMDKLSGIGISRAIWKCTKLNDEQRRIIETLNLDRNVFETGWKRL